MSSFLRPYLQTHLYKWIFLTRMPSPHLKIWILVDLHQIGVIYKQFFNWNIFMVKVKIRREYRILPGGGLKMFWPPFEKILWGQEPDFFFYNDKLFMYFKRVFLLFWQFFSQIVPHPMAPTSELQGGRAPATAPPLVSAPGDNMVKYEVINNLIKKNLINSKFSFSMH